MEGFGFIFYLFYDSYMLQKSQIKEINRRDGKKTHIMTYGDITNYDLPMMKKVNQN